MGGICPRLARNESGQTGGEVVTKGGREKGQLYRHHERTIDAQLSAARRREMSREKREEGRGGGEEEK